MASRKKDPDINEVVLSCSGGGKSGVSLTLRALMPNCGLLLNDFIYFLDKAKSNVINEIGNSYARAAIIFMAFYLEALINLIIDHILKTMNNPKMLNKLRNSTDIPKKFKEVYLFICHDHLIARCDINGIEDLFYRVRSQIFAHPRSYGITSGANVPVGKGLTIDEKEINYGKLILPNTLDHFRTEHAQIIYDEIKQFLSNYYDLVKPSFPEYLSYYFYLP